MVESDLLVPAAYPIPIGYRDLLVRFYKDNSSGNLPKGELLTFNLGKDAARLDSARLARLTVYNPAPIEIEGQLHIWARVDERAD